MSIWRDGRLQPMNPPAYMACMEGRRSQLQPELALHWCHHQTPVAHLGGGVGEREEGGGERERRRGEEGHAKGCTGRRNRPPSLGPLGQFDLHNLRGFGAALSGHTR